MFPMLTLAAIALATMPQPSHAGGAVVQATATIRILTPVRLRLDGSPNADAPPPRDSVIKAADGSSQRAKLIEFQ
jgi:hypothetical protein